MRTFELRLTNRPVREKYKMNIIIPEFNQVYYGKNSLRTFVLELWNSLRYLLKIYNPSKEQLNIGMENSAYVRFVIVVNKLIFRFNIGKLFY